MVTRKDLIIVMLTFCLTATLFTVISTKSSPNSLYDPWFDYDDDGDIDSLDLFAFAPRYGSSGEPVNKTALLLELQARIEILEANMFIHGSTNSSVDDLTFSADYREMLDMSLNINLTRRSRLLIMFSSVVGVYFPNDVIVVRALVNESIAGEIGFFPQIGEMEGHRHWLGFRPSTFNFVQLSDPGFYTIKIEWKISEGGGGVSSERTLTVIALPT